MLFRQRLPIICHEKRSRFSQPSAQNTKEVNDMATANPAMNESVYRRAGYADSPANVMTINGAAMKTLALVAILLIAGSFTWDQVMKANVGAQAGGLTITPTT